MPSLFGFGIRLRTNSTRLSSQSFNAGVNDGDPVYFNAGLWKKADVINLPSGIKEGTDVVFSGESTLVSAPFIADRFYYLEATGGLTLEVTSVKIGRSISTTKLLVDIDAFHFLLLGKAGYSVGGNTGTAISNNFEKLIFQSDNSASVISTLSANIQNLSSSNSVSSGYSFGGTNDATPTPADLSSIDKIDFSNEIRSTITTNLNSAKTSSASFESEIAAYVAAGSESTISKVLFSDDSITNLGATNLTPASLFSISNSGCNSLVAGYVFGGKQGAPPSVVVSNINKLQFNNDSTSNTTSSLATASELGMSYGNKTTGYYVGGLVSSTPVITNSTIEKFNFSDEARSAASVSLSNARYAAASFNSALKGYVGGGLDSVLFNNYNQLIFSTDINSNITSALSIAKINLSGLED